MIDNRAENIKLLIKQEVHNLPQIEKILKRGMKFNKKIYKLVEELIQKASEIKNELKTKSKEEKYHMTHRLDEYLDCIPTIYKDKLNNLLQTDLKKCLMVQSELKKMAQKTKSQT